MKNHRGMEREERRMEAGTTLLESLTVMAMLGVVMGSLVLTLRSADLGLPVARQQLTNDLRLTRADSNTRGAHYLVTLDTRSYSIERLQDDDEDGEWFPDTSATPRNVELPPGILMSSVGGGSADDAGKIEFDTRGMLVSLEDGPTASAVEITMMDRKARNTMLRVWPSGQVQTVSGYN